MSEKLLIKSNGQWELRKDWSKKDIDTAHNWVESGMRHHLDKLPAASGETRTKMLQSINEDAEHRVNSETGEKEYKAYRTEEHGHDKYHDKGLTSWSTDPSFTEQWAEQVTQPDLNNPNWNGYPDIRTHTAWIPEKHIHSYLTPEFHAPDSENDYEKDEREILVHPHKINIISTEKYNPQKIHGPEDEIREKIRKRHLK